MPDVPEKVMPPFPAPEPATVGALALGPGQVAGPPPLLSDGLTPATVTQVRYWRELCGAVSLTGSAGMRDGDWPAALAPARLTTKALQARGLFVRRERAWHLKRGWYGKLAVLRATAVSVPESHQGARPRPDLPTYGELHTWEAFCLWLDSQPRCLAWMPMADIPGVGTVSGEFLQALRHHRLVRLSQHSYAWILSPRWKELLRQLWQGVAKNEAERPLPDASERLPFSLGARIDTWYLNWIDERGLSPKLATTLDDLQETAQQNGAEVKTPWTYDGSPLRMYQYGSSAAQSGGVSWSFILRNASLMLLLRRKPLGGIVAQARLGSECLTRLTARRALDELHALVQRMWSGWLRRPRSAVEGRWQVSQVHLAHDVANTTLDVEQLDRYVSRSRRQATYEASAQDVRSLFQVVSGNEGDEFDDLYGDIPAEVFADAFAPDLFADDLDPFVDGGFTPQEDIRVEDRAVSVYRWGRRLSGVTWSPGGEISLVAYDKVLESRLRRTSYLHPLWRACGWDGERPVTRFEARLRRGAFRKLGLPP